MPKNPVIPASAKEAYKAIKELAHKIPQTVTAYCQDRGISHSTVTRWRTSKGGFNIKTYLQLVQEK